MRPAPCPLRDRALCVGCAGLAGIPMALGRRGIPPQSAGRGSAWLRLPRQVSESLKMMLRKTHHAPPNNNAEWRPVPGYDGIYASEDGEIWSAKTGTLKTQRCTSNGKGYRAIWVWERGRDRERRVHRLVALAFHGEPPTPSHTPDHINRVRTDNRASNLRWATPKEQAANSSQWERKTA